MFELGRGRAVPVELIVHVNVGGHVKMFTAEALAQAKLTSFDVRLPAGAGSAALTVTTANDHLNEGDGEVVLTVRNSSRYRVGKGEARVLVQDDDIPEITLRLDSSPEATEGDIIAWRIMRSGALGTVDLGPQLAVSRTHYTAVSAAVGALQPPRVRTPTVSPASHLLGPSLDFVAVSNEVRWELYGHLGGFFSVQLLPWKPNQRGGGRFGPQYTVGDRNSFRVDTVPPNPTVIIEPERTAVAAGEPARFRVRRYFGSPQWGLGLAVAVDVSATAGVLAGTAPSEMEVSFPAIGTAEAGGSSIAQRRLFEAPETIEVPTDPAASQGGTVTASIRADSSSYRTAAGHTTATVRVDVADGSVARVAISDAAAAEDAGPVPFTVTRTGATGGSVTVHWATGTAGCAGCPQATPDTDYTAVADGRLTLLAGEASATIEVAVADDDEVEGNEYFRVTLSQVVGGSLGNDTAIGTIRDDDDVGATVTIAAVAAEVVEGRPAVFTLTRTGLTAVPLDARITLRVDGAEVDPLQARFPVGGATATLSVATDDDAELAAPREYEAVLQPDADYTVGDPDRARVRVIDNDGVVTLELERSAPQEFGAAGQTVAFGYTVTNGGNVPTAGAVTVEDSLLGTLACGSAALAAGASSACDVAHTITAAEVTAGTISSSAAAVAGTARSDTVTVTLQHRPSVAIGDQLGPERGALAFPVTLSATSARTVTVDWATTDSGTASPESDFTATSGTMTFAPGEQMFTVTVAIVEDAVDEDDEQFTVELSNAAHADLAGGVATLSATGTIVDDDERGVTVEPRVLAMTEGASLAYTVVLTSAPAGEVAVAVAAGAGSDPDVTALPASLTFTAQNWAAAQTVTVSARQDADAMSDLATFEHTVSGADYDAEDAAPVAVAVDDDETPAPGLALTLTVAHEDADGSGGVTLGDVLRYTAQATNSGNVALANVVVSDLLVDTTGQECATLAVGAVCELTGTYSVTQADVDAGEVSNTAQASAGEVTAEPASAVTAVAQERALGLAVSTDVHSFAQVGDVIAYTYTVTNSGTVTLAGTVTVADDTVTGITCVAVAEGGLAPAAATTCSTSYATMQADVDAGEVVSVATASVGELTSEPAQATVPWLAGDESQAAVLAVAGAAAAESAGAAEFVVSLSPSSLQTVTVAYATADVTAEAGPDYTEDAGTLTFAPGATAGTIAVAVSDDELAEDEESFRLELSEPWNATLAGSVEKLSAAATITDDDAAPVITSGTALTVVEGATAIAGGQLSATDADHAAGELTWSIPADEAGGVDGALFTITDEGVLSLSAAQDYENPGDADGDRVYEVTVQVSDGVNAATADLEVTLQDVQAAVTVAPAVETVEEGAAAVFTVTRAGDLSGTLTVAVEVGEAGTVLAADEAGVRQVELADGVAEATLSAATEDDATPEPGGTVTAAVQTGTGYALGDPATAAVAVLDNDASTVTLSLQPAEVAEAAGTTEVTVTAAWAAGRRATATELTVEVGRSGDAATEGTDYATVDDLTLTIAAGAADTSGTFTLKPVNDALDESDETLTVSETAPVTGLTVTPALLTIRDDDERGILVQPETLTVTEGEYDTYTVVLTSQPTDTVTVTPAVSGAGAGDVSVSAEVLTFTSGNWSTTQTVTVTAEEDDDADDDKATVEHTVGGADYGANGVTAAPVAVTVDDDETRAPGLAVTLTVEHEDADGSGDVTLGDVLRYTARATNSGNVALANVVVSDLLVDTTGQECATLAVGAVCELTGTYSVTQADVDAGEVSNTAQASADGVTAQPASAVTAVAQERALGLAVSTDVQSFAQVGDEIAYTYTVTNSGTVTLAGTVTVADDTVTEITCVAVAEGGLAPGAATTCSASYATVQGDVDVGEVTNSATASLGGATSAAAQATVPWLAGDENQGSVLAVAGAEVAESAGAAAFVVSLSPSSLQTVTVAYATADVTAVEGPDYTGDAGTLTFTPGATARTIAVAVNDDELAEDKESFRLELSEAWNATLAGSVAKLSAAGTITDDDAAPVITSGTAFTVAEGATAIPNGQLSATDDDHAAGELTWSIPAGTAGGADRARFELTSGGVLSLRAAQDYETPADTGGDGTYEVTVQVSDGANPVTADLKVTLQDVAAVVTVAADADTVEEGAAAEFTVTRAGDLSGALTVAVAVGETGTVLTSGGSGTKRVSFSGGAASATLSAATEDDATPEPGGTVTAAVQSRSGYTVGTPGRAEVTVLDNDASTVTLSAQPQEVTEAAGTTEVTVTAAWAAGRRAAATALTLEVGRATDTATEGSDYTTVQDLTLTIAAGAAETSGTFTLAPVNDALDESDETLTVTTEVTGLTVNPASVKILDDDQRGIVVQPRTLTITEGERDRYTVVLSSQPTGSGSVTVSPSVSGNSDVSVSVEVLTFTATSWSTEQTVTVSSAQDDDADDDEARVEHTVGGADYGANGVTAAPVAVTVDDDETPAPGLELTLTVAHEDADGSGDVTLGDVLEYTARATNSGNVALANVVVSDRLVDTGGSQCSTLAVGAVCELTGTYTVRQADVDAGEVRNTARTSADEVTALTKSEVTAVAQERALGLAVSANPSSYAQGGDEITYTYTVTNSGTVTLAGTVTVTDDTVTGVACSALPSSGLAPGGTTECSGSYPVTQGDVDAGEVTNSATASLGGVMSAATATVPWRRGQSNQAVVLSMPPPVAAVAESAGEVAFAVSLSASSLQTVTVAYATVNETAEASLDYTGTFGTLTFTPGATARTIAVAVNDDELEEETESFALELSNPWNATLAGNAEKLSRSVTITDDDAAPVITSGTALTVAEGATAIPNGQLSATDGDHAAGELTWSIPAGTAGGEDRARFAITSGGLLSLGAAQDHENPGDVDGDRVYEVTVAGERRGQRGDR